MRIRKEDKIAQSTSIEGLAALLNKYFYSTSYRIVGYDVYNANGFVAHIAITPIKRRGSVAGFLAHWVQEG